MKAKEPKVMCLTPTPGKQGTRIDQWKYDAQRRAIRKVVSKNKTGVEFVKLPESVRPFLADTVEILRKRPLHLSSLYVKL